MHFRSPGPSGILVIMGGAQTIIIIEVSVIAFDLYMLALPNLNECQHAHL